MKRIFTIAVLGSILSCSSNAEQEETNQDSFSVSIPEDGKFNDRIEYNNEFILIEEIEDENESYAVQKIEKSREDLNYTAKLVPSELYLRNQGLEGEELQVALDETRGEQVFYFEFQDDKKVDLLEKYYEGQTDTPISYLSFQIGRDFRLINAKGDTLLANYALYEPNYHVAPFEKLTVSFPLEDQEGECTLLYNDNLFGKGNMSFSFAPKNYLNNNTNYPS